MLKSVWISSAFLLGLTQSVDAQSCLDTSAPLWNLTSTHDYTQKRSSSYARNGGNADARPIPPGETLTVLDDEGPGVLTHVWFTIASPEELHLKKLVLRIYWDGESSPSVESPVGDFFGLGLGEYFLYQSIPLSVGADKALNSFFVMPFQKHARVTVSNEGSQKVDSFYFNIDYRACAKPLAAQTLYFHAQYRQAAPAKGWTNDWKENGDPKVNAVKGDEKAGSRTSVYRFHLDSPIPFTKSLKATIEHGHANHRSDNFYSVAYWYQTEPHSPFPALPAVAERLPQVRATGGPGSPAK